MHEYAEQTKKQTLIKHRHVLKILVDVLKRI